MSISTLSVGTPSDLDLADSMHDSTGSIESMCVDPAAFTRPPFLGVSPSPLTPSLQGSLNPEGRDLMEITQLSWSVLCSLHIV